MIVIDSDDELLEQALQALSKVIIVMPYGYVIMRFSIAQKTVPDAPATRQETAFTDRKYSI